MPIVNKDTTEHRFFPSSDDSQWPKHENDATFEFLDSTHILQSHAISRFTCNTAEETERAPPKPLHRPGY